MRCLPLSLTCCRATSDQVVKNGEKLIDNPTNDTHSSSIKPSNYDPWGGSFILITTSGQTGESP
jgi:hypothetical protein